MRSQSTRFSAPLWFQCELCGKPFARNIADRSNGVPPRFCAPACYHAWRGQTYEIRAFARLNASTVRTPTCWLTSNSIDAYGYGRVKIGTRQAKAHQFAWFLATGTWPAPGELVLHTCDRRNCWRNDGIGTYEVGGVHYQRRGHLWLGTNASNSADMAAKGRAASGDRNGMRLYPERIPRGILRWSALHPERLARGDKNGSRLHPESRPRGEQHARAALTAEDVREIRRRYAQKEANQVQLAAIYNTTQSNIGFIVRRQAWKHIE